MVSSKRIKTFSFQLQCRLNAVLLVLVIFGFASSSAFAACHAVIPTGSGSKSGADWNNAFAGIPGTLIRGDIYYFADGSYGSYTFAQSASGTTTVEFRKAQSYDNGSSCGTSIAAGWNTSTMGSGQAVFTGATYGATFTTNAPYFILNGNGQQSTPGCGGAPGTTVTANPPTVTDCGFKLDNTGDTASVMIYNEISSAANVTYEYVELAAPGDNTKDQHEIFGPNGSNGGPSTYAHIYGHNAGCVWMQDGGDTRTVSYSYFWGTETNGAGGGCHGQFSFEDGSTSNSTDHDNVYRDITGTAIWTFANSSTTHNNWEFYNNVIWFSSPKASWSPYLSDGLIACINAGTNCTNFTLIQNSIINVPTTSSSGINNENTGSYTVQNNLWYIVGYGTAFNAGTGGTYTQDHNAFLNAAGCPSGTGNTCDGSYSSQTAPNPFSNWTNGSFSLASENSDWTDRVTLAVPYTIDPNNITRLTDRGTYQNVSGGAPQPPQNLTATVH
jgi:hypothetical protein